MDEKIHELGWHLHDVAASHAQALALNSALAANTQDGLVVADVNRLGRGLVPSLGRSRVAAAVVLDDLLASSAGAPAGANIPDSVPSDSVKSYSLERRMTRGSSSVRYSLSSVISAGVTAVALPPPVTPVAKPSGLPETV